MGSLGLFEVVLVFGVRIRILTFAIAVGSACFAVIWLGCKMDLACFCFAFFLRERLGSFKALLIC